MRTRLKELKRDLLKEIRDLLTEKHSGSFEFDESEIYTNIVNDLTGYIDSYKAVGLGMIGDTIVIDWVEASLFDEDANLGAQLMLIRESVENLVKIHEALNG